MHGTLDIATERLLISEITAIHRSAALYDLIAATATTIPLQPPDGDPTETICPGARHSRHPAARWTTTRPCRRW